MSIATLLVQPQDPAGKNAFSFEHAMAHRGLQQVMGPLSQWTVMPYFVDPTQFDARSGTNWYLNHQQAHQDFIGSLPAFSTATEAGIPTAQILLDRNPQDPGSQNWWTFLNNQEHYIANNAIFPLPLFLETLPFWLIGDRYVPVAW